jgi:DDE superfamily endonuclease
MVKSLSLTQQSTILSLLDAGCSGEAIAKQTGVTPSTISKLCSKHHSALPKAIGGHPSKLSPTNICHAQHLITSGKAENAVQVTKALTNIINQPLSANTVCLHLKKAGMKAVVKSKCPLLSARHCKAHLDFAYAHKDWTIEDWKKVIWSDETKINHLGSDGHKWAWKRAGEGLSDRLVDGTLKFGGGSLIMWGCMTWEGVGFATKIDGRMDGDLYLQILKDELQQTLEYYGLNPPDIIFQQDNDPKHTCRKVKNWLEEQEFRTMVWPAQSPDLNPIEHLWGFLKRRLAVHENPPNGIHELWERVQVEWDRIPVEECQKLIESMPRRVQAVIRAKGGYTKY